MKKIVMVVGISVVVAKILGCQSLPKEAVGAKLPACQSSPKEAVVVSIDGKDITKKDIQRKAKVFMTLRMNRGRRTQVGVSDRNLYRMHCKMGAEQAVLAAVLNRYAEEHHLTNDTATIARMTKRIERNYGAYSKKLKRRHTIDDLKYMLGSNSGLLDETIKSMADYYTVTNSIITSNPIEITEDMITNRIHSIERYNTRMTATNTLIFVQATNLWRRIVGKELTFEEAATNYSEDVYIADGCEWGTFSRDQLADDEDLTRMLPDLKVGDITAPVKSDGGLAILRLDAVEDNKNFTFSRVFFRLPIIFEVDTPAEAREFLLKEAEKNLIKRELDKVRAELKIEYPNGTNLFEAGSSPLKITKEDLAN